MRSRIGRSIRMRPIGGALALALALAPVARAAAPPQVLATWSSEVASSSARLDAEANPEGAATTYRFEYLTETRFLQNGETFAGALKAPASGEPSLGSGSSPQLATQLLTGLSPQTAYRYRLVARNSLGTETGPARAFTTEALGGGALLADGRAWEMVSPVDKNGGQVDGPGQISGGGVLQAAADGESATFSSTASFGAGAQGAPVASQYVAHRGAGGWSTQNVTLPTVSGAYGDEPDGVPYRIFSTDLARALLLNGRRCPVGEECPRSYSLLEPPGAAAAVTPLPEAAAGMRLFGASPDLRRLVFEKEGNFYEWSGEGLEPIAPPPPPSDGTTRTSADGQTVAFLSTESLTGYDNIDQTTGEPDSEVFIENAGGLHCVSCNPTNERPIGPSTFPGAIANGSTRIYQPRVLSAAGTRLFFESSDALVLQDTDNRPDAYEWEAQGEGSCARPGGCVSLLSSGRGPEGSTFVDASASGSDAFFLTSESLVPSDPGSIDLYDARVGGGFPEPSSPIACEGDACQSLPPEPEDPTPGTLAPGSGQPPLHFPKQHHRKKKHGHKRHRRGHKRGRR